MTLVEDEVEGLFATLYLERAMQEMLLIKGVLQPLRTLAHQRLLEIGFPGIQKEAFGSFAFKNFHEQKFAVSSFPSVLDEEWIQSAVAPECQGRCLVFVNGRFRRELSLLEKMDGNISLLSLEEAMKTFGHFLQKRLTQQIKEETDPFALLNTVLHPEGFFIYVPPKMIVDAPFQILHLLTREKGFITPRLHVCVGAGAHFKLYTSIQELDGSHNAVVGMIDIALEDRAECIHFATASTLAQSSSIEILRASVKKGGSLKTGRISQGDVKHLSDIEVSLLGEGSSFHVSALGVLSGNGIMESKIVAHHKAPHTVSMQKFKGVLRDYSRSSFEGKIIVDRIAQKTNAYQLSNYLLLGEFARALSKPNLEISADDVKASHGSTVAKLQDDLLFYLKSRGLNSSQAKTLLVEGFCGEIIASCFLESLRLKLAQSVENRCQTLP